MLYIHLYKIVFFFYFFCFLIITVYILNFARAIKKMPINETIDFIFENFYKRIGFSMENSYYLMKRLKKKRFVVSCKQIDRKNT